MSLMNDIIDRAARNMDVRERLGAASYSGALQALIERVETYLAAKDSWRAARLVASDDREYEAALECLDDAESALRAAVTP